VAPAISTGACGYPVEEAARVAPGVARGFLESNPQIEMARFILFSQEGYGAYARALQEVMRGEG
jgi:O-acetyl-ADP-ribose deacetylase (regulator of RNase III)